MNERPSQKDRQLPIGKGKDFIHEREKLSLPAVEVKTSVHWTNPAFEGHLPFILEKLGMFFDLSKNTENKAKVIITPEMFTGRSGMVGGVIFRDQEGHLYRDVDRKGMGLYKKTEPRYMGGYETALIGQAASLPPDEVSGLLDLPDAEYDRDRAEEFLSVGIRTTRTLAILLLQEVVGQEGEAISIYRARQQGIVPSNFIPVIEIRAFGTRERISSIAKVFGSDQMDTRGQAALEDAKYLVAQELGKDPDIFPMQEYLSWFARTLGEQVATMHRLKKVHLFLHDQNITLDSRIVDLDSIRTTGDEDEYKADVYAASYSLSTLCRYALNQPPRETIEEYGRMFNEAYQTELQKQA